MSTFSFTKVGQSQYEIHHASSNHFLNNLDASTNPYDVNSPSNKAMLLLSKKIPTLPFDAKFRLLENNHFSLSMGGAPRTYWNSDGSNSKVEFMELDDNMNDLDDSRVFKREPRSINAAFAGTGVAVRHGDKNHPCKGWRLSVSMKKGRIISFSSMGESFEPQNSFKLTKAILRDKKRTLKRAHLDTEATLTIPTSPQELLRPLMPLTQNNPPSPSDERKVSPEEHESEEHEFASSNSDTDIVNSDSDEDKSENDMQNDGNQLASPTQPVKGALLRGIDNFAWKASMEDDLGLTSRQKAKVETLMLDNDEKERLFKSVYFVRAFTRAINDMQTLGFSEDSQTNASLVRQAVENWIGMPLPVLKSKLGIDRSTTFGELQITMLCLVNYKIKVPLECILRTVGEVDKTNGWELYTNYSYLLPCVLGKEDARVLLDWLETNTEMGRSSATAQLFVEFINGKEDPRFLKDLGLELAGVMSLVVDWLRSLCDKWNGSFKYFEELFAGVKEDRWDREGLRPIAEWLQGYPLNKLLPEIGTHLEDISIVLWHLINVIPCVLRGLVPMIVTRGMDHKTVKKLKGLVFTSELPSLPFLLFSGITPTHCINK